MPRVEQGAAHTTQPHTIRRAIFNAMRIDHLVNVCRCMSLHAGITLKHADSKLNVR
jgi:hypothetical protein